MPARARAFAAIAIAIASAGARAAPDQALGTLFTTPQERERLDRLRRGEPEAQGAPNTSGRSEPTITGFVRRSDGRNTVWIDGTPVPVRRRGSDALLDPAIVGGPRDDALRIERKTPR